MSTPARIIPFPSVTAPDFNNWSVADTTADIDTRLRDAYRESSSAAEGSAYRERITIDELYSADQALTPELSVALSLLAKGLEDVDEALAATQKGSDSTVVFWRKADT